MSENQDLRPLVIGVNSTLILMSILAVGCRVGKKIRVLNSFSWHDSEFIFASLDGSYSTDLQVALITFAAICAIMFSLILMIATRHGAGLHQEKLSQHDLTIF